MKRQRRLKRDLIATARILSEALPFLRRYDNARIVIKLGGHAMAGGDILRSFAHDIVLLKQVGVNPVIVHGGGPKINQVLASQGVRSQFIDGKRVSDPQTVEVVEMVLSGTINKRIVQEINNQGGKAVGISGKDGAMMICDRAAPELGCVGEPAVVSPDVLTTLSGSGYIPVVAPLGVGRDGETLNVNSDSVAGAIAAALPADRLLLLTDVQGVMDEEGRVLSNLSSKQVEALTTAGVIKGGMIPKTETALGAVENGVGAVVIMDGRVPNAVLLELFTEFGAGSMIRAESD